MITNSAAGTKRAQSHNHARQAQAPVAHGDPSIDSVRQRIVKAATRLFAVQGYTATTVRQLVEASACARPSLYYYFDSKEVLFTRLVEQHLEHVERLLEQWQHTDGTFRQRTHRLVDQFVDYAQANPDEMRLLRRLEMGVEPHMPQINLEGARELQMKMLMQIMEQGIISGDLRDDLLARDCAGALIGALEVQFHAALETEQWNRERMHRTVDLIFDGIVA